MKEKNIVAIGKIISEVGVSGTVEIAKAAQEVSKTMRKGLEIIDDERHRINESIERWTTGPPVSKRLTGVTKKVKDTLKKVPGMKQAHGRDFYKARTEFILKDKTHVKMWSNALMTILYLEDKDGKMAFGGYVLAPFRKGLENTLEKIEKDFGQRSLRKKISSIFKY